MYIGKTLQYKITMTPVTQDNFYFQIQHKQKARKYIAQKVLQRLSQNSQKAQKWSNVKIEWKSQLKFT